jgi:ABC-type uncharacterized transport system permease subunit
MDNDFTALITVLLYLGTATLLGLRLVRSVGGTTFSKTPALTVGMVGVLLHALVLYQAVVTAGGVNLGFFYSFSIIAWLIAALLLAIALFKPVENLGLILMPFAAVTVALTLFFPSERVIESTAPWELRAHILLSVAAYALLALAAVQSVVLAVQDRQLRNRRPAGLIRALPPLQAMEELLFQLIGIGFIFLSLALASGVIFLEDIFAQHLVHKTLLSLAAWGVFGALLWGRRQYGWRGRTAIRWTLSGFAVLVLAYFGTKLALEIVLQRVN